MRIYLTLHTDGSKANHKRLYDKFNEEYNTSEHNFIGDGLYYETDGIKAYDLTKNKYIKLRQLFIDVGFNKKYFYYSRIRKILFNNKGDDVLKYETAPQLTKLINYPNSKQAIYEKGLNRHIRILGESYIMFHRNPVYTVDNTDDFKPEHEKVYMKETINSEADLKRQRENIRLIQIQQKEIKENRIAHEEFNKKHNIKLIIKVCSNCGYTDEKGIYNNYKYYYDENNKHVCNYDVRKN